MGSRILLADDSITIQKVVNLTFADEGIEVIAVSNGDLAERRLNEVKPDLVLADIFMPGKNGYELCELIKQNPQFRNVPVVLLVGAFEPFDQAEARRVQADAHLTKPFESRTLVETVRRLISASGRAVTGPIAPLPSPGEGREEMRHTDPLPPHVATPIAPKLDLSEMMADHSVPAAPSPTRHTGELTSFRPGASPQVFNIPAMDMPAHETADTDSGGTSEKFDPMNLASRGEVSDGTMHVSPVPDQPDMILDFDKVDTFESPAAPRVVSFESEANFEVEAATGVGSAEGAEWLSHDHLDSPAIHMPSTNNGWQASSSAEPVNGQAADFRMPNEAAFGHPEESHETAVATMLAVDDPLGDVLLDETDSSPMLPFGHDLLDIELSEPPAIEASAVIDTHFDLVDTAEDSSGVREASAAVLDHMENELELNDTDEELSLIDHPESDLVSLADEAQAEFVDSDDILDWTSTHAGSYSTAATDSVMIPLDIPKSQVESVMMPLDVAESRAESVTMPLEVPESRPDSVVMPIEVQESQPDSVPIHVQESQPDSVMVPVDVSEPQSDSVMPIDTADSLTENPAVTVGEEVDTREASFERASSWLEEEARFTAIDIEAFPVEESEVPAQFEASDKGFSITSVMPEEPGSRIELPPTGASVSEHSTNGATAELSAAAIEAIVRRVVAEMSESVVREVAWEVVPDCVERVIGELTRESLSRRS